MARPVVSTALGAEGLTITPGRNILIAETPRASRPMWSICWARPSARPCWARRAAAWSRPAIAGAGASRGWTASTDDCSGARRHEPAALDLLCGAWSCAARHLGKRPQHPLAGRGPRSVGRRHGRVSKPARAAYARRLRPDDHRPAGGRGRRGQRRRRVPRPRSPGASVLSSHLAAIRRRAGQCLRSCVREGLALVRGAARGVPAPRRAGHPDRERRAPLGRAHRRPAHRDPLRPAWRRAAGLGLRVAPRAAGHRRDRGTEDHARRAAKHRARALGRWSVWASTTRCFGRCRSRPRGRLSGSIRRPTFSST